MKKLHTTLILGLTFALGNVWGGTDSLNHYKTLATLQGDWVLSPMDQQEGGATKKGPTAKLIGTDGTAMSFKVIGKGSAVQENLLPGTGKEMATMYHCDNFKECAQVQAKHYCAKQNQPELVLDAENSSASDIASVCDMSTSLCSSAEGHVHKITHELSKDGNHLKTTYTIYQDEKFQKDSIYHFDRKN